MISNIDLPNVGSAFDSQRIKTAYNSVDYIHWPNVGSTDDSQRIPYIRWLSG